MKIFNIDPIVSDEDFVRIWNDAAGLDDAVSRLGLTRDEGSTSLGLKIPGAREYVQSYAYEMRKLGHVLKTLLPTRDPKDILGSIPKRPVFGRRPLAHLEVSSIFQIHNHCAPMMCMIDERVATLLSKKVLKKLPPARAEIPACVGARRATKEDK